MVLRIHQSRGTARFEYPLSNEKEISHGTGSWQTRWSCVAMGPLASSIGWICCERESTKHFELLL